MLRCPELSKLPKAPIFGSINFRRQTPGSAVPLIQLSSAHAERLDPSHPAVALRQKVFPNFRHKAFSVRPYPMALLGKPLLPWPEPHRCSIDTWEDRIERARGAQDLAFYGAKGLPPISQVVLNNERPGSVPMSFMVATSKKRTSAKKVIRSAITRKLKTSLTLIITRGAGVAEVKGRKTIVFDQEEAKRADDWVLRGWSYIFYPTIEMYKMPYHDLIPLLRLALRDLRLRGRKMEAKWEALIPRRMVQEDKLPRPWKPPSVTRRIGVRASKDVLEPNSRRSKPTYSLFDDWQAVREEFESGSLSSTQPVPDNQQKHSPQTSTMEKSERKSHHVSSTRPRTGNWRDRSSQIAADAKSEPNSKLFKSSRSQSDNSHEREPRSSAEMERPLKPKRFVTADTDDAEKSSVKFFKRLSQKRAAPTRTWRFRPDKESTDEIVDSIRKAVEETSSRGNATPPPRANKAFPHYSPPDKRAMKVPPDSRKNNLSRGTAPGLKRDEDLKAQIQDALKNRLSKPNFIFRPPTRPK